MRITDKAKKILTLHFGEEKTKEIIDNAIIGFNKLDGNKVEEILHLTMFYSSFWEDCDYSISTLEKDFHYLYSLLNYDMSKILTNTTFKFGITNGEVKINEINL